MGDFTESNQKLIEEFCRDLLAEDLSERRIIKYRSTLGAISRFLGKKFTDCDEKTLKNFFADLAANKFKPHLKNPAKSEAKYADSTKRDMKIAVKRFWRWLKPDPDYPKKYPREVAWISTSRNRRLEKVIRDDDVLTEEEVYKMVDFAPDAKSKAIISCLFESACRIGELQSLKVGDIVFSDGGYHFFCYGKTGEAYKPIHNFKAVELMEQWLKEHPLRNSEDFKNAPLWTTSPRANIGIVRLDSGGIRKMLRHVAILAKIPKSKPVNPHWFRHSRISQLDIKGVPRAAIEQLANWVHGSSQFQTYSHIKNKNLDDAMEKIYHTKEELEKSRKLEKIDDVMKELWKTNPQFKKIVTDAVTKGLKE